MGIMKRILEEKQRGVNVKAKYAGLLGLTPKPKPKEKKEQRKQAKTPKIDGD